MRLNRHIARIINLSINLCLIVFSLVLLWVIGQVFFFATFKIPSNSMEPALKAGDVVWVWKPIIGARIFNLNQSLRLKQVKIYRLPGMSEIRRNDILVFNFPHPNHWDKIEMHILKYFAKRCIGIPGDTLFVSDGKYHIPQTGSPLGNMESQNKIGRMTAESFAKDVYTCFPYDSVLQWTIRDMGPLYIPKEGDLLPMNRTNYVLYRKLIEWETGQQLTYSDSIVFMANKPLDWYRFQKNYYFMGGDNGTDSQDSRYWGLLPEEYIVGKVWMVWKSFDPYTNEFRWDRWMKRVK